MKYIHYNFVFVKKKFVSNTLFHIPKFSIKSWSIVFFGSDNYSLFSLKELQKQMLEKRISSIEVVVPNELSVVHKYASTLGLKTHLWPPELNGSYDFGVIVSFGKFIPKRIIDLFSLGIINVHASLLPKYRGGMPIVHAVKNGEITTGVTVTRIRHDKFDTGEIILQRECSIDKNELMPSLYRRLTHMGCDCLLEVIKTMPECLNHSFQQSDNDATYAPKLTKEAAVVRWMDMTAIEIFNLHRAFFGTFQLTSKWQNKQINFICLSLCDSSVDYNVSEPGVFVYDSKTKFIFVRCKEGFIKLCSVKFNKRIYSSPAFHSGYLHKVSDSLWKFES